MFQSKQSLNEKQETAKFYLDLDLHKIKLKSLFLQENGLEMHEIPCLSKTDNILYSNEKLRFNVFCM